MATKTQTTTTPTKQPNCIDANGHLNIYPIIEIAKQYECPFIALIGEKRIGKTYGCVGYGLKKFYETGEPMFYVRRYDKTFNENICGDLVRVHKQDIINLSGGKHNNCDLRGKYFDLVRDVENDNTGRTTKQNRKHFAFCRSLNNVETETADDKGGVSCVVYDEFLTRGNELKDEFNRLMIIHANATGKRTEKFTPMFLLGNTVSRESDVAESFGVKLRELKRGVNIITNKQGVARLILYYSPETSKSTKAAATFYDRFENDRINMISHGDWTIGTYQIANEHDMSLKGVTLLLTHNALAVSVTIAADGIQPRVVVTRPLNYHDLRITSGLSKTAVNTLPRQLIQLVLNGFLVAETAEIGENFRDICKHINGGKQIVDYIG